MHKEMMTAVKRSLAVFSIISDMTEDGLDIIRISRRCEVVESQGGHWLRPGYGTHSLNTSDGRE